MVLGLRIADQLTHALQRCTASGRVGLRRLLAWLLGVFAAAHVGSASAGRQKSLQVLAF